MRLTPDPKLNERKRKTSATMKRRVRTCPNCQRRAIYKAVRIPEFGLTVRHCHFCRHEW